MTENKRRIELVRYASIPPFGLGVESPPAGSRASKNGCGRRTGGQNLNHSPAMFTEMKTCLGSSMIYERFSSNIKLVRNQVVFSMLTGTTGHTTKDDL